MYYSINLMFIFLGHNSAFLMNFNPLVPLSTYIVAPVDLRTGVEYCGHGKQPCCSVAVGKATSWKLLPQLKVGITVVFMRSP